MHLVNDPVSSSLVLRLHSKTFPFWKSTAKSKMSERHTSKYWRKRAWIQRPPPVFSTQVSKSGSMMSKKALARVVSRWADPAASMAFTSTITGPELMRLTNSFLNSKIDLMSPTRGTPSFGAVDCSTGTSQLLWLDSAFSLARILLILDWLVCGAHIRQSTEAASPYKLSRVCGLKFPTKKFVAVDFGKTFIDACVENKLYLSCVFAFL